MGVRADATSTPDLQRSLGARRSRAARWCRTSRAGSPAERAGLRAYDVIVDVEGRDVAQQRGADSRDLGAPARHGGAARRRARRPRQLTVTVKLAERPGARRRRRRRSRSTADAPRAAGAGAGAAARPDRARARSRRRRRGSSCPETVAGRASSRASSRLSAAFDAAIQRGFVHPGNQPQAGRVGRRLPAHRRPRRTPGDVLAALLLRSRRSSSAAASSRSRRVRIDPRRSSRHPNR